MGLSVGGAGAGRRRLSGGRCGDPSAGFEAGAWREPRLPMESPHVRATGVRAPARRGHGIAGDLERSVTRVLGDASAATFSLGWVSGQRPEWRGSVRRCQVAPNRRAEGAGAPRARAVGCALAEDTQRGRGLRRGSSPSAGHPLRRFGPVCRGSGRAWLRVRVGLVQDERRRRGAGTVGFMVSCRGGRMTPGVWTRSRSRKLCDALAHAVLTTGFEIISGSWLKTA